MPSISDSYAYALERKRRVKAKLKKLGIDPRSNKYSTLLFRWMRQS